MFKVQRLSSFQLEINNVRTSIFLVQHNKTIMLLILAIWLTFLHLTATQNTSPCPNIFAYEPKGSENDRWYGHITVTVPNALNGIWLKIFLDKPAELLGNWFGEATSADNREYLIKNAHYHLQPNREPLSIRFFVKYKNSSNIPSLKSISLNGRVICPAPMSESPENTTPTLHISHLNPDSNHGSYGGSKQTTSKPIDVTTEDDFFPGDFSGSRPVLSNNFGVQSSVGCGTVKMAARPLITYGQETSEGEWPWHVALYRTKGTSLQYICGGSLISANYVLTAAHCVTKSKTAIAVNPELLMVYLGKYSLYKVGPNVQSIQVLKITPHPEFNGTYLHNDLAVLQLEVAAEITDFVRTVCLWEDDVNLNSIVERLGTVVGWGFDQTGELTENLMMAKMPVVATDTCIYSNRDFFSRFATPKSFCAGFRNGTSACTGDSGGGMVFPKTSNSGTVWQLRGIISLSAALQSEKVVCDTHTYIIFTDVAKYNDWIRRVMNR